MHNTGTWNSDLALFYLIVFLTPLWLKMIFWTISAFGANTKIIRIEKEVPVPVNVYKNRIVYRDRPSKPVAKPVVKTDSKKKDIKAVKVVVKEAPIIKKNVTDISIMSDVVSGLKTLGVHKSQGRELVEKLCKSKQYSTAEDLLQDCIAHIHKLRT